MFGRYSRAGLELPTCHGPGARADSRSDPPMETGALTRHLRNGAEVDIHQRVRMADGGCSHRPLARSGDSDNQGEIREGHHSSPMNFHHLLCLVPQSRSAAKQAMMRTTCAIPPTGTIIVSSRLTWPVWMKDQNASAPACMRCVTNRLKLFQTTAMVMPAPSPQTLLRRARMMMAT